MAGRAGNVRVFEIAKELGLSSDDVLRELRARGIQVKSHMSSIDAGVAGELDEARRKGTRGTNGKERALPAVRRRRRRGDLAEAARQQAPRTRPAIGASPGAGIGIALGVGLGLRAGRPSASATAEEIDARTRFEAELASARRRTEARRRAEERAQAHREAERHAHGESRPAVGTVIPLPSRRLVIDRPRTERRRPPTKDRRKRRPSGRKPSEKTRITTPAEHKRVVKIADTVAVSELARAMSVKAADLLKHLWGLGVSGVHVNSPIDFDTAALLAAEHGYEVKNVSFHEEEVLEVAGDRPEDLAPRPPVVTVMGHVDHGKTTLLDAIRETRVAAGESGGITQHIGAYRVRAPHVGDVVFIDTPGHEAFAAMRSRGARATDIVVLLVAADDGVMPQTVEALQHARAAEVPIVVAVSKCDLPDAKPGLARSQLAERGLVPEEWGGDVQYVDVSATRGDGITQLLDAIGLTAELLDLRANPGRPAVGVVIEAKLDRARGPVATVLVQQGALRRGDTIVSGEHVGRVRAMFDDRGREVERAGPSTPVEVLGMEGVPEAGDAVQATDEKTARRVADHRSDRRREQTLGAARRLSLQSVMAKIRAGEAREVKVVLKTDTQGTAEALRDALTRLSTEKVGLTVVRAGVGGITESDLHLALASGALIVGFRVRPTGQSARLARREGIDIRLYEVVYDAVDDLRRAMLDLLPPVERERELGRAEVREVYRIPKVGVVAGCSVRAGTIRRGATARLWRDGTRLHQGRIATLRRFKEDVAEVSQGYECGLSFERFHDDIRPGDLVEVFETVTERATL